MRTSRRRRRSPWTACSCSDGAYGTNAGVNWKTKELKIWVVQQIGPGPRPWNKLREEAENRFFARKQDNANLDAYTGLTK